MTVLKSKTLADVYEEVWTDELRVKNERRVVTLGCDWPECKATLTATVSPGFMRDQGWRYCGTGAEHLCDKHSHHSDSELTKGEL